MGGINTKMNALHLTEFNIIKGEENQYDYLYYVEVAEPPMICPQCMRDTFCDEITFKLHDSKSRDINFDVLRIKCLYGTIATKRPAYGEKNFYAMAHMLSMVSDEIPVQRIKDYNNVIRGFGVNVDMLLDLIDNGRFWL